MLSLTLVIKDFDYLAPLVYGDVASDQLDLRLDRDLPTPGYPTRPTALSRTLSDPSIAVGELSLARHIARLAEGDRTFVGIPHLTTRVFRHRCFFVPKGSPLRSLSDLQGARLGTNEWPATGNTWARALMREEGVDLQKVHWWVGSVEGAPFNKAAQGTLPPNARFVDGDRTLVDLLLGGELDGLVVPTPPRQFDAVCGPIVRLLPDFRAAEQDYFRRTGIFPGHHIVGVRRAVYEEHPWILRPIFDLLEGSRAVWQERRLLLNDTTPWMHADHEETVAIMGADWSPTGIEANRAMLHILCRELYEQGLAPRQMAVSEIFPEFEGRD
jgi:4,5-dihydroxyphthalate decarboxylase